MSCIHGNCELVKLMASAQPSTIPSCVMMCREKECETADDFMVEVFSNDKITGYVQ